MSKAATRKDVLDAGVSHLVEDSRVGESGVVCMTVTVHQPGFSRRCRGLEADDVLSSNVSVDARGSFRIDKNLFKGNEKDLSDLTKAGVCARQIASKWSLPSRLGRSTYCIPVRSVVKVNEEMEACRNNQTSKVEVFITKLPGIIKYQATRLGSHFNVNDYPTPDQLRQAFAIEWSFFLQEVPNTTSEALADLFKEASIKYTSMVNDAIENAEQALAAEMVGLVQHLASMCHVDNDGKVRKLHSSAYDNLAEFLRNLELRDVSNSPRLKELAQEAQEALRVCGGTSDILRVGSQGTAKNTKNAARAIVSEELTKVGNKLNDMIEDHTDRREFNF